MLYALRRLHLHRKYERQGEYAFSLALCGSQKASSRLEPPAHIQLCLVVPLAGQDPLRSADCAFSGDRDSKVKPMDNVVM